MKCILHLVLVGWPLVFATAANCANIEWFKQLGSSARDGAYDVTADAIGNVIIVGRTDGDFGGPYQGFTDAFVTKYDATGDQLWARQFGTDSSDVGYGVAADAQGSVYVTGSTSGNLVGPWYHGSSKAFLFKFDAGGNLLWKHQSDISNSHGIGVAADELGFVYISGFADVNARSEAFLSKYSASGDVIWSRRLSTPAGGTARYVGSTDLAVDKQGNIYTAGATDGSLAGPNAGEGDAFLAKYDANGEVLWTRQYGTILQDSIQGVSIDPFGNIYATGQTDGSLAGELKGNHDAFLIKCDSDGNLLWARQSGTAGYEAGDGVSTDRFGNAYVTGFTDGDFGGVGAGNLDVFISMYGADGDLRWTRQFGTEVKDTAAGIVTDGKGHLYVAGTVDTYVGGMTVTDSSAFLAKITIPEPSPGLLAFVLAASVRRTRRQAGFPAGKGETEKTAGKGDAEAAAG